MLYYRPGLVPKPNVASWTLGLIKCRNGELPFVWDTGCPIAYASVPQTPALWNAVSNDDTHRQSPANPDWRRQGEVGGGNIEEPWSACYRNVSVHTEMVKRISADPGRSIFSLGHHWSAFLPALGKYDISKALVLLHPITDGAATHSLHTIHTVTHICWRISFYFPVDRWLSFLRFHLSVVCCPASDHQA